MSRKEKIELTNILPIIGMIIGLCLLIYPVAADWIATNRADQSVTSASATIENMSDSQRTDILRKAELYNEQLFIGLADDNKYNNELDIDNVGTMCSISIPSIGVEQPVYHGSEENVLMSGAGHVRGTSLPVGGNNTHTVIAGHTGMPGQRMFDDVDKMQIDDIVEIHVLNETLYYKMTSSEVVDPGYSNKLEIIEGEDLLTLVTCTPYGINDHRLLVHCERIDSQKAETTLSNIEQKQPIELYLNFRTIPFIIASLVIAIVQIKITIGKIIASHSKKKTHSTRRVMLITDEHKR